MNRYSLPDLLRATPVKVSVKDEKISKKLSDDGHHKQVTLVDEL